LLLKAIARSVLINLMIVPHFAPVPAVRDFQLITSSHL